MVTKLALLLSAVCVVLLPCELWARYRSRAWPFESPLYVPDYLTERDMTLLWRYSPSEGRNSLGLRNREIYPKNTDAFRILFLGDSLVWSGETSSGRLYTEVLEGRLNALFPHDQRFVEIINAGIPGYTTYQELEFLKLYGLDMRPDLVVLGFVFNDVYYKYLHRPTAEKLLGSEPTASLHRFDPSVFPGVLFARSYLAHELADRGRVIWNALLRRPRFPFERRQDLYLAWKGYGWNETRALIGEMRALLSKTAIPLLALVFPISDQVDERYRQLDEAYLLYPQSRIREISRAYGIPTLDLTEPIHMNGGVALYRDYLHLNPKGNDVVAHELEKFLVDRLQ